MEEQIKFLTDNGCPLQLAQVAIHIIRKVDPKRERTHEEQEVINKAWSYLI